MTHNGTTSMTSSLGSSQILSSPFASLSTSASQHSFKFSKILRQASTLFLTRRLSESLYTLLPVITPPEPSDDDTVVDGEVKSAPISTAPSTTRVKIWSLYLTLLNACLELDSDKGKQLFGSLEWRRLCTKVRDGEVWDEVVKNGYRGMEGEIDAEVVINLATLLLAHARTQKLNQRRLEAYLAASSTPKLDINARAHSSCSLSPNKAGNYTDRELHARFKIIELYTLHILLRNDEWDYSKEFITLSGDLGGERREELLQALEILREERDEMASTQRNQAKIAEKDVERRRDGEIKKGTWATKDAKQREQHLETRGRKRGSEVDYGIEYPKSSPRLPKESSMKASSQKTPIVRRRVPPKPPQTIISRAGVILSNMRSLCEELARNWKTNSFTLLRMLSFVLGMVMLLGRKDIRDKLRASWLKLRQTIGMGMKVSYI